MTEDSAYGKTRGEGADLGEFARILERGILLDAHTVTTGVVTAFVPGVPGQSPPTVAVQPTIATMSIQDDGSELLEPRSMIPAAILGVFSSTTHKMTHTPVPGDAGILLASERAIDVWRSGGVVPEDPAWNRTHDFTDSFFLPVGSTGANPVVVNPAGLSLATNTGSPLEPGEILIDPVGNVTVEGPIIRLGRAASQPAVLGALLQAALTGYANTVAAAGLTHAAVQPPTAVANAVYLAAITGAATALATASAAILSAKTLIQ